MKSRIPLVLLAVLVLSSCATVFTGTKESVYFSSEPQGATIKVDNQEIGTTPGAYEIKRKLRKQEVSYEKQGFDSVSFKLKKRPAWISFLCIAYTPIDLMTGSFLRIKDHYQYAKLGGDLPKKSIDEYCYLVKNSDTIFTKPIDDLYFVNYKSLKDYRTSPTFEYETLEDEKGEVDCLNVSSFGTLRVTGKGLFKTKNRFTHEEYLKVLVKQKKKKNKVKKDYAFMLVMVKNGDKFLLKKVEAQNETSSGLNPPVPPYFSSVASSSFSSTASSSYVENSKANDKGMLADLFNQYYSNYKVTYYYYNGGGLAKRIKKKKLYGIVKKNFSDETDLLSDLKGKSTFRALDKHVARYSEVQVNKYVKEDKAPALQKEEPVVTDAKPKNSLTPPTR